MIIGLFWMHCAALMLAWCDAWSETCALRP